MRISSMSPWKYSPQMLLPPMRSGPVEVVIAPLNASCPAWTPLTKTRSVVPSYVVAMCVQVLSASEDVPLAIRKPPLTNSPVGTIVPESPPCA